MKNDQCKVCGIWGFEGEGDVCDWCEKYNRSEWIYISDDKNRKHLINNKKCPTCDWFFYFKDGKDIDFPVVHEKCGGLIHFDKYVFCDDYSCDIELIFECDKCKTHFSTWTEGESFDDEFKKIFGEIK